MKRGVVFILLVISVLAIKCSQDPRNEACFNQELKDAMKDSVCVNTCEGVCACNGSTYCNECEAMKQGYEVYPGDTLPCSQI